MMPACHLCDVEGGHSRDRCPIRTYTSPTGRSEFETLRQRKSPDWRDGHHYGRRHTDTPEHPSEEAP